MQVYHADLCTRCNDRQRYSPCTRLQRYYLHESARSVPLSRSLSFSSFFLVILLGLSPTGYTLFKSRPSTRGRRLLNDANHLPRKEERVLPLRGSCNPQDDWYIYERTTKPELFEVSRAQSWKTLSWADVFFLTQFSFLINKFNLCDYPKKNVSIIIDCVNSTFSSFYYISLILIKLVH